MYNSSDWDPVGLGMNIDTEKCRELLEDRWKESQRKEAELYGQMSKWSDLYNQIQNQLYEENQLTIDCIKDLKPVGGGIVDTNGLLNDSGKKLTLLGIKGLQPALSEFIRLIDNSIVIENYSQQPKTTLSDEVQELFNRNGSDKGNTRDYHIIYAKIFEKLGKTSALNILEIGLGSQNVNIPSRMSGRFTVGGSLRAYKEFFPNANIFGAGIDKEILFSEDRIKTSYVDQLEINTFNQMHNNFGSPTYDLVIDDGLHSFVASLNTLNFALKYTKKEGGIIILEDLSNINLWQIITKLLMTKGYQAQLYHSKGYLLIVYL